jgi:hypothetical protein
VLHQATGEVGARIARMPLGLPERLIDWDTVALALPERDLWSSTMTLPTPSA